MDKDQKPGPGRGEGDCTGSGEAVRRAGEEKRLCVRAGYGVAAGIFEIIIFHIQIYYFLF